VWLFQSFGRREDARQKQIAVDGPLALLLALSFSLRLRGDIGCVPRRGESAVILTLSLAISNVLSRIGI
jgi:hypothetical protein